MTISTLLDISNITSGRNYVWTANCFFCPMFHWACSSVLAFLVMQNIYCDKRWKGARITPYRLIFFRFYNITIGSFRLGEFLLRKSLLLALVNNKKSDSPYCQSSDFFTYDQIDD